MADASTKAIKAPISLYVIWVVLAVLLAIANRIVGVVVLALGAIHILTYPAQVRATRAKQAARAKLESDEEARKAAELERVTSGPLEPITTSQPISRLLTDQEECYWEEPAIEWRMQTYVHLGSQQGLLTSTKVVPEQVGSGTLAITEARLLFCGDSHVHNLHLSDIVGVGDFSDGIRVVDARERTMLFVTANNYAAIILRRAIAESNSGSSGNAVAELPSHCTSCGAPLRLVHHVCQYCGAPVVRHA